MKLLPPADQLSPRNLPRDSVLFILRPANEIFDSTKVIRCEGFSLFIDRTVSHIILNLSFDVLNHKRLQMMSRFLPQKQHESLKS